jgi:hypothetical protein
MTTPAAAGERFLATGEFLWMADIARALRDELRAAAGRVTAVIDCARGLIEQGIVSPA